MEELIDKYSGCCCGLGCYDGKKELLEWHVKSLIEARKKWLEEEIATIKKEIQRIPVDSVNSSWIPHEIADAEACNCVLEKQISRLEAELKTLK